MNDTEPNLNSEWRNQVHDFLVAGSSRRVRSPQPGCNDTNDDHPRFRHNSNKFLTTGDYNRRRRRRSRISIELCLTLIAILSLAGCSRQAHLRAEDAYRDARAKFERGDLAQAIDASDQSYRHFQKSQVAWAWRFRVLKAEVLVWQGKSKDSLELLAEDPPASLTNDEAAVRRKIVQSIDYYYLQEFDKASECINEAEQLRASGNLSC